MSNVSGPAPTGSGERILVTGGTGFVGRQLVKRLLEERPGAHLVLMVRPRGGKLGADRARAIVRDVAGHAGTRAQELAQRVTVVDGDIARERFGLGEADLHAAADGVTHIIHSAATVNFDEPLHVARSTNVMGTANILALARQAHKAGTLKSLSHVSTAYVAGEATGIIREDQLEPRRAFRNTYERTKCEAEGLVRQAMGELPIVITRPSIVVGDSQTGMTTSFNTVYPLRVYASGKWNIIPARTDTVLDIVPVDFVADGIMHLAFEPKAIGKCAHLSAGLAGGVTVRQLTDQAADVFKVARVRIVPPSLFTMLVYPLAWTFLRGGLRRLLMAAYIYMPYLRARMRFDTTVADALLTPAGIRPPSVQDYVNRVLRYCVESDWGKRPIHPPTPPRPRVGTADGAADSPAQEPVAGG